jgi:hypothetical protein
LSALQGHHLETGFHWERARRWSDALHSYYESAMLLDQQGLVLESRKHLLLSYAMFCTMRTEADLPPPVAVWTRQHEHQDDHLDNDPLLLESPTQPERLQAHFDQLLGEVHASITKNDGDTLLSLFGSASSPKASTVAHAQLFFSFSKNNSKPLDVTNYSNRK